MMNSLPIRTRSVLDRKAHSQYDGPEDSTFDEFEDAQEDHGDPHNGEVEYSHSDEEEGVPEEQESFLDAEDAGEDAATYPTNRRHPMFTADDEAARSLNPEQLVVKGSNLWRWENAQKDFSIKQGHTASPPPSLVPKTVSSLLDQTPLRQVTGKKLKASTSTLIKFCEGTFASKRRPGCYWNILSNLLPTDKKVLANIIAQMEKILSVYPVQPDQIPLNNMWLLTVAKELAFDADETLRLQLGRPYPDYSRTHLERPDLMCLDIPGYDAEAVQSERFWKFFDLVSN